MEEYCIISNENVNRKTKDNIINLVLKTLDENKQVLIFNNSKSSSEATAEKIANSIETVKEKETLKKLSDKILKALSTPTKQCRRLASVVERGVAFHHSGLVSKQRDIVEKGFKEGFIKTISSTPTLAAGMNLPAYKVIIKDYKRYSSRGFNDIPILEYHQMSGRAGRPGIEDIGKAVICVKTDNEIERVIPKYIFGKPEEILSKLAIEPTLKMYILSLVSMNMINSKDEIKDFFANTLYAKQYQDLDALYYNIFRILGILKDYNFISQDDDYYMATQLGRKVSELYINPDTANYFLENIEKFIKIFSSERVTRHDLYSFMHFALNTNEMKPYFRVGKAEEENYAQKLQDIADTLTVPFDPFEMDYMEFASTIKTTDVMMDWINEAPEDYMSEKYKITPGELNYKIETMDWLLYCIEEMAHMKKSFYFKNYVNKLRIRLKKGVREELLPLVKLKGIGRARARKLFKNEIKRVADIKTAGFEKLSRILGESIAIKLLDQVIDTTDVEVSNSQLTEKPKEIKVREVTDEEVDMLVTSVNEYEKEKDEVNKSLSDYF